MPLPSLEPHPLSKLTPAMSGEQFQRLLEDVVVNGVKTPIVLYEGKILDGVNRYNAAKAAGRVEIPTETFEGTKAEAIRLVMSLNAHRRHMNATQRAMLAASVLREIKSDEAVLEDRLAGDTLQAARSMIERRDRAAHIIWPPKEGFPATAPEELRAFARDHGIENVAVEPLGDEADFDNPAARGEIDKLVADGYLDPADVPEDFPDADGPIERFSAERKASSNFASQDAKIKRPRGRPKNSAKAEAIASVGVSKATVERFERIQRDGSEELKQAVSAGFVSTKKGAEIAKLPKDEQAAAIIAKPAPRNAVKASTIIKALERVDAEEIIAADGIDTARKLFAALHKAHCSFMQALEERDG